MRRKKTASVEASTTVSLAYASEYGFGRTSGHAAMRYLTLRVVDCPTRHDEGDLSHPLPVITAMPLLSHFTMSYLDMGYFATLRTHGVRAGITCNEDELSA